MSIDPSAAIGRIDAAVEESSRRSAVPPDELADLAAAIQRIEALIVDGAAQGPDGSAAVGRIADIAFTLHEREVESSLGDELTAAVREINDVGGLKQLSPERARQAAELLRQLSRRVHDMIAQSQANQSSVPAAGANAAQASTRVRQPLLDEGDGEDDASDGGSFKTDVPEDDEFALVVAALTAALPSLAEFGAPVPVPPAALAQDAAPPPDGTLLPELSVEAGDEGKAAEREAVSDHAKRSEETLVVIDSSSAVLRDEPVLPQTPSSEGALGEDFLHDLMPTETPAAELSADVVSSSDAPAKDLAPDALLALPAPKAPADSTHEANLEPSSDLAVAPEDDPGDLFESTMPEPSIAPNLERAGMHAAEKVPDAETAVEAALSVPAPLEPEPEALPPMSPQQSRAAASAPARPQPVPRPASNDPLGPVRALSEEETIALFS